MNGHQENTISPELGWYEARPAKVTHALLQHSCTCRMKIQMPMPSTPISPTQQDGILAKAGPSKHVGYDHRNTRSHSRVIPRSMPSQSQRISTQEAKLRTSLKASGIWSKLTDKQILSLQSSYRDIIEKGIRLVSGYDSSLRDIREGASRIEAICPYDEDPSSKDDKRQALEKIRSTLAKHGLPYPIPASGAGLLRLKEQWPTLRVKRRRIIRQELCVRYSLPLNTAWEEIRKKQRWFGESAGDEPTKTEKTAHSFRQGICTRCGVSHSAALRFEWNTCQPINSAGTRQDLNLRRSKTDSRKPSSSSIKDETNRPYKERPAYPEEPVRQQSNTQYQMYYLEAFRNTGTSHQEDGISMIDIRLILEKNPKILKTLAEAQKLKGELERALADTTDEAKRGYRLGDKLFDGKILVSRSMRERLQVKVRHCESAIEHILEQERQRKEENPIETASKPTELKLPAYADQGLLDELWNELSNIESPTGYIYLKRWNVRGESAWYKLGITSNPKRRDAEQNVLPVPAETLFCYDVGSIDRARAIESKINRVLCSHKIVGSQNRELFHLSEEQVSAIMAVMNAIER